MKYKFEFDPQFKEDEKKLRKENAKLAHKLWEIVFDIDNDPFDGIGKPEALKHVPGLWSRRIDQKHRLIYRVEKGTATVHLLACYGHYGDR